MTDDTRMIDAAKRKARRMARKTPELTYQQALDQIARGLGRTHWTAFLADPVQVPRDEVTHDVRGHLEYDVPIHDEEFMRKKRVALFGMSATTLYVSSEGDHQLVGERLANDYPGRKVEFIDAGAGMIDSYLGSIANGKAGRYAPTN